MYVKGEVKLHENSKKNCWGWGGGGSDGCEQRSEAFVKIQKKKNCWRGGDGWVGSGQGWGSGWM